MIVTNNQRVAENYQNAIYIDGDMHELYQKVRDFVYDGHKLHTHPLSASIGMLHSPVKSVILSDDKPFDQKLNEDHQRKYSKIQYTDWKKTAKNSQSIWV